MSTDKNHNQEIKVETNILKFPNCKENQQLADHKKLNEQLINSIATKMAHDRYDQLPLIHEELLLLTNRNPSVLLIQILGEFHIQHIHTSYKDAPTTYARTSFGICL